MKTMYEINWHYKDNEQTQFSHCTVTPIEVLREGILPGCSAVSITAKGSDGRTFQGSPRDYFESEAQAWDYVRKSLAATACATRAYVEVLNAEVLAIRAFLAALPAPEDKS